jgi:glutathione peroxidase
MTKVWTYWECQSCGSILRGDIRTCPNCGAPVANTTKYLMPDNPKVIDAIASDKIITSYSTSTDEKGITAEIVPQSLERSNPNYRETNEIKWNFTKFLLDHEGNVVSRFEPTESIDVIEDKIRELL